MTRRLGLVLLILGTLAALALAAMGAIMLVNRVPDAGGGAGVMFVIAALCAGAGAAASYVLRGK